MDAWLYDNGFGQQVDVDLTIDPIGTTGRSAWSGTVGPKTSNMPISPGHYKLALTDDTSAMVDVEEADQNTSQSKFFGIVKP
ncbi:MAG: hypothetical protein EXR98_06485 [Gemmataceae bacterium]|nr:hypothetical protein [Gemmataceae bacterium]